MENKKSHKNWKIAAIALAAVLLLSVGAVAVSQSRITSLYGETVEEFDTPEAFNDSSTQALDAKAPEAFSNGFTFAPGSNQKLATASYEDGGEASFDLLTARYTRGDALVCLNLTPDLGRTITNPDYVADTLAGVTVYCFDGPELLATTEVEEPDALDYQLRSVVWFADGTMYQLYNMDQLVEMDELMDMAAELIGK